jgi:sialic acid synthase SpsE
MIWAASENGADYAKFQSWEASKIPPGPWDSDEPFFQFKNKKAFYETAQLTNDQHYTLIECCKKANIKFLTTCFDRERVDFLSTLGIEDIKVASCDSTSSTMIKELSEKFNTLICSTGMTTMEEIWNLKENLLENSKKGVILHCISMYPTPLEKISIDRLLEIKRIVGSSGEFGISDHSLGTTFPKLAVTLGATWIEKHFTTDVKIPGPDNYMSITPDQLLDIRNFCTEYEKIGKDASIEAYDQELELRKVIQNRFGNNS